MKVASFLPAVTQMIYDMGLQDQLCGITFECPKVALNEKPVMVRCVMEGKSYTSDEINTLFSESKATGESLYYVDEEVLKKEAPAVIFTQDVCEVCQIDTECTSKAVYNTNIEANLISISPDSLEDVFDAAFKISEAMGCPEKGLSYVKGLKQRISNIIDKQRSLQIAPKSVLLLEWIDPLFNCGHWIPHQIGLAGGVDLLSHPAGDSIVINWDKIVKYNPEVIVIAPCGYDTKTTLKDMKFLEEKEEWNSLRAVKNKQVFLADFDMFTQPSASTLVNGIEVLAAIFHPELAVDISSLSEKFSNYFEMLIER